jgi:hypothetical protein
MVGILRIQNDKREKKKMLAARRTDRSDKHSPGLRWKLAVLSCLRSNKKNNCWEARAFEFTSSIAASGAKDTRGGCICEVQDVYEWPLRPVMRQQTWRDGSLGVCLIAAETVGRR